MKLVLSLSLLDGNLLGVNEESKGASLSEDQYQKKKGNLEDFFSSKYQYSKLLFYFGYWSSQGLKHGYLQNTETEVKQKKQRGAKTQ